jgi:hypothetical protein
LGRHGIGCLYEAPVAVVDRGKIRVWYPDFRLPDYGILIEYEGRCGDPAYMAAAARKVQVYRDNGLAVVSVTPKDLTGDWPNRLLDRIERVLVERVERFRQACGQSDAG